ncbi:protein of unknown function (plasmid) [Agrobacterium pusense]|uniref:Uncharacterized protein n=1 Tax=Agrobacterium pusense TaxID=648995 RepID=U4Q4Y6_9HYPH|nr:protein of unknown function [Agrobacterium pusense]
MPRARRKQWPRLCPEESDAETSAENAVSNSYVISSCQGLQDLTRGHKNQNNPQRSIINLINKIMDAISILLFLVEGIVGYFHNFAANDHGVKSSIPFKSLWKVRHWLQRSHNLCQCDL